MTLTAASATALALNATSVLNVDLGTSSDLIACSGTAAALTLDGNVNITAGAGFAAGTYTIITYSGTLTDNTLMVGTRPSGWSATIRTSVSGQVQVVILADAAGVNEIWTGAGGVGAVGAAGGTASNGAINHGSATNGNANAGSGATGTGGTASASSSGGAVTANSGSGGSSGSANGGLGLGLGLGAGLGAAAGLRSEASSASSRAMCCGTDSTTYRPAAMSAWLCARAASSSHSRR